jgi:hypothetical protein
MYNTNTTTTTTNNNISLFSGPQGCCGEGL